MFSLKSSEENQIARIFQPHKRAISSYWIAFFCISSLGAAGEELPKTPEGDMGIAAKYPMDKNIGKDPAVIFASGFEDGFSGWTAFNNKVSVIDKDPMVVHSGSACVQTTATKGKDTGGDINFNLPKGEETLYLRFYCKFHHDTCFPHHFVKLRACVPGFWPNAGHRPAGDKGFWTGIETGNEGHWFLYTYWFKMRSWNSPDGTPNNPPEGDGKSFFGNVFGPYREDSSKIKKDEWICIEMMMKCNAVGKSDGEQAFWIDGKNMGHWRTGEPTGTWIRDKFVTSGPYNKKPAPFEGYEWRSSPTLLLNAIALQWYISKEHAEKYAKADENIVYFDDVVVATEYIGPMLKLPSQVSIKTKALGQKESPPANRHEEK